MEIKQLTNIEFKEFSKNFKPSSIFQTTEYALTMNHQGYDSVFIGLIDNGNIIAASLVLITKIGSFKYAYAPKGYLIDYNNFKLVDTFTSALKTFLGKKDIVAIKINPNIIKSITTRDNKVFYQNPDYTKIFKHLTDTGYFHLGYNNYFESLKPRFDAVINLNSSNVQLFANIKKNFRTKIKNSIKNGIKIYHGNINNLDYLYEQTKDKYPRNLDYFKDLFNFYNKDNMIDFYYSKLDTNEYLRSSQKQYHEYERKSLEISKKIVSNAGKHSNTLINEKLNIDKMFSKYKEQLVEATNFLRDFPSGIILSTALVVRWGGSVYLVMDGYDTKYKNFNAKHLMLWQLISKYSKIGYKTFNLGGMVNNFKIIDKYKGLNEFKFNFNAKSVEYAGDFELITNSTLYFLFKNSKSFSKMFKKN